jgi:hypothetical protein
MAAAGEGFGRDGAYPARTQSLLRPVDVMISPLKKGVLKGGFEGLACSQPHLGPRMEKLSLCIFSTAAGWQL